MLIMKQIVLSTALMLAGVLAFAQNTKIINDPNAQKRNVGEFHGVQVGGGIELFLSQGTEEAVAVSANDPEIRDRIVTEVRDGVLHIHLTDQWWRWPRWPTEESSPGTVPGRRGVTSGFGISANPRTPKAPPINW